jgi:hypothetical protein
MAYVFTDRKNSEEIRCERMPFFAKQPTPISAMIQAVFSFNLGMSRYIVQLTGLSSKLNLVNSAVFDPAKLSYICVHTIASEEEIIVMENDL